MNNASNVSTNQINTQVDYAEGSRGLVKSLKSAARTLFESAEHASKVAVVVLGITLAVISLTRLMDCGTVTAQYCEAISKVVVQ